MRRPETTPIALASSLASARCWPNDRDPFHHSSVDRGATAYGSGTVATNWLAIDAAGLSGFGTLSLGRLFSGVDRSPTKAVLILIVSLGASFAGTAAALTARIQIREAEGRQRGRGWAVAGVAVGSFNLALVMIAIRLLRSGRR